MRSPAHLLPLLLHASQACTNILVTRGASATGEAIIGYNADDSTNLGGIPHWPAAQHDSGTMREVYSWDSGQLLGAIPQPARTFNVMGNANEKGLVITETTHGGLAELSNTGKTGRDGYTLDYASLIWITLQRAATAREAIDTMVDLANEYGYASSLEGFSIADADEVWYMELLGRGNHSRGVLWVALRVPDGYITAHANHARITTFLPCDDATRCRAAPDVVSFAVEHGLYPRHAPSHRFSFSDVFDPLTFEGARFCEARVWYIFSQVADPRDFDAEHYLPYARGEDLTRRMPLFVRPKERLTRRFIHELMGSHYEGSALSPYEDVGAGSEHSPYRWNGLMWQYKDSMYSNERPIGTQYTTWHMVATVGNASVPGPMRALQWFGLDDSSYSPKIPVHGGAAAVHSSYDDGDCTSRSACRRALGLPGTVTEFSWENAWWVNNVVADVVMTRLDRAAPVVLAARRLLHSQLEADQRHAEDKAARAFARGDDAAGVEALTRLAVHSGAKALDTWVGLWQRLMVLFIDGQVTNLHKPTNQVCGCSKTPAPFTKAWKEKVVSDTGDRYRVPQATTLVLAASSTSPLTPHARPGVPKLDVRGVAS